MLSTTIQFNDHSKEVAARVASMTDMMMANMAAGIEIQIKTSGKTPYKHGGLRASARHQKISAFHYQVSMDKQYAAAQEAGTTRGHQMKKYTTSGTGKGFFKAAIDNVKSRASYYAQVAMQATGLGGI